MRCYSIFVSLVLLAVLGSAQISGSKLTELFNQYKTLSDSVITSVNNAKDTAAASNLGTQLTPLIEELEDITKIINDEKIQVSNGDKVKVCEAYQSVRKNQERLLQAIKSNEKVLKSAARQAITYTAVVFQDSTIIFQEDVYHSVSRTCASPTGGPIGEGSPLAQEYAALIRRLETPL